MNVKIQFSPKELRYMSNTDFLLTKRVITDKLYNILHELTEILKASPAHRNFNFPAGTDFQTGKISRGENYKGLPYVILDFPRLFEKENVFAFRTVFWWGSYFSFTLHLKGNLQKQYRSLILENLREMKKHDVLVYSGDNEWEHDLDDTHYIELNKKSFKIIRTMNFIKLARKVELEDYKLFFEKGLESYELFLDLLMGKTKNREQP